MKKILKPLMTLAFVGTLAACGGAKNAVEGEKLYDVSYIQMLGRLDGISTRLQNKLLTVGESLDKKVFTVEVKQEYDVRYNSKIDTKLDYISTLAVDMNKKSLQIKIDYNEYDVFGKCHTITVGKEVFQYVENKGIAGIREMSNTTAWAWLYTKEQAQTDLASYEDETLDSMYIQCLKEHIYLFQSSSIIDIVGADLIGMMCSQTETQFKEYLYAGDEDKIEFKVGENTTLVDCEVSYDNFDDYYNYSSKGKYYKKVYAEYEGIYLKSFEALLSIEGKYYYSSDLLEDGYKYYESKKINVEYGKAEIDNYDLDKIPYVKTILA